MTCWALVPFKALHLAKQRLAPVLRASQRQRLAADMLQHVLGTLQQTRVIDQVVVTSPPPCTQWAQAGVQWLPDHAGELNGAVAQAAEEIWQRGATELIVLHGDLPQLCSADLQALRAAGQNNGLALAPDRYGQGTNALYVQRGCDWTFSFGPGSCQRHLQQAAERGYHPALVHRNGFACDIDAPAELALWRASYGCVHGSSPIEPSGAVHQPHAVSTPMPFSRRHACL